MRIYVQPSGFQNIPNFQDIPRCQLNHDSLIPLAQSSSRGPAWSEKIRRDELDLWAMAKISSLRFKTGRRLGWSEGFTKSCDL